MGLLKLYKKVSGSTLVETLVGTVIIVVIFAIASLTLNRVFKNVVNNNTVKIDNQLYKLQYLHQHQQIRLPYQDDFENWEIQMQSEKIKDQQLIELTATNTLTEKVITKKYVYADFQP